LYKLNAEQITIFTTEKAGIVATADGKRRRKEPMVDPH